MAHMLINCTNCNTPLQLPPGATVIRCVVCHAFTHVADSRAPLRSVTYPPTSALTPFLYSNGGQHYGPHPGPNPLQYSPAPSHPYGSKKAVICGISYRYSRHELKGCLNDAKCMKYFLTTKFDFPESAILMLTEEEADPLKLPTKHNMRMALYWLVKDCRAGDSLVFHFSGHGSQQVNLNGEELDGFDETLCPLDFETQGMLVDDEINATIVRPLPPGVRLHAIVDACHSGTVLDLPFVCKFNSYGQFAWEDQRPRTGTWKGTSGGEAYSFSGCDDDQTSADTSALSQVTSTGAMTFCFIQAIERGEGRTYGSLLNAMRYRIHQVDTSNGHGGPITSLIGMLLTGGSYTGGLTQEPQLSAANIFDINMPFYL